MKTVFVKFKDDSGTETDIIIKEVILWKVSQ